MATEKTNGGRAQASDPNMRADTVITAGRSDAQRRQIAPNRPPPKASISFLWACTALIGSIFLRVSMLDFESGDFRMFLSRWYDFYLVNGRWAGLALNEPFASYSPLYMYLISLSTALPLPKLYAIKLISICSDYLAAFFLWRLAIRHMESNHPLLVISAFLFLPTVVLNSAFWGQCDVLYTTALLASFFYLLEQRSIAALVAFGVAGSIKPQAIFWCPFLAGLILSGQLSWKLIWIPAATYFACGIPALLAGRSWQRLVMPTDATATVSHLTWNAPNWYQWIWASSQRGLEIAFWVGIVLTLLVTFILIAWMRCMFRKPMSGALRRKQAQVLFPHRRMLEERNDAISHFDSYSYEQCSPPPLSCNQKTWFISAALFSLIFVPFLLPGMHERYFFSADVFSLIYAIAISDGWCVALLLQAASLFSYVPFLFGIQPVPLALSSLLIYVALAVLTRRLLELLSWQASGATSESQANNQSTRVMK